MKPIVPMLHATAPFFAAPPDRAAAEFALTCLARVRFLSVDSLLALAGPRGLRRELVDDWVAAGLVYRGTVLMDPIAGRDLSYLALTTRGARTLQAATGEHAPGVSNVALKRGSQKRAHDLCVGEVAASFLALEDEKRVKLLGVEVDDKRIGTSTVVGGAGQAPERVPLQADGLIAIQTPAGPSAVLLEIDMGSVAIPRMARKYAGYLRWMREGGPGSDFAIKALRVVTLATTEARLRKLHDAALEVNYRQRSGFLLFGLISDVNVTAAEKVFGPVVRQLGAEERQRVPLFSLTSATTRSAA